MSFRFHIVDTRAVPVISVYTVEDDAWLKHIHQGVSPMLDRILENPYHVFFVPCESARDKTGISSESQRKGVDRRFDSPIWRGLGFIPFFGRWGVLPLGETINLVVLCDVGDINIAAHGVDKVISTNSIPISITSDCDDDQFTVGERHSGSYSQWSTMDPHETINLCVIRHLAPATDA